MRDDLGRVLLRSHSADIAVFPPYEDVGFSQTATHRLYFDAALRGTITIAIAGPITHRAEVSRESLMTLALPLFVVIPLSLSIGLAIADGAQARFSLHSPTTGRPDGFEARFQVPLRRVES